MHMRIHQTGQNHLALQIHKLGLRTFHRDRFFDSKIFIDRHSSSMMQDQIRASLLLLGAAQKK